MTPNEAEMRVLQISRDVVALRDALRAGDEMLLDEEHRALLSGAALTAAWIALEEAPTP